MAAGRSSSMTDRIGRQYEQQFRRPASADDPQYAAYIKTALPQMIAADKAALEKSQGRWKTADKFAWGAVAAPFAMAAAPVMGAFGGGAAAASAAPAAASGTTAGAGMTFGNLLKLGELGTGLVTNVIGQRQQNKALDRDSAMRAQEFAQQQALIRETNAQNQRQWEADQAQKSNVYAMDVADRDRKIRLEDEREARRAPYRQMAQQARMRLGDLLRLGGR